MDPYQLLNVAPNPDGSLTRHPTFPTVSPSETDSILCKDTPLDAAKGTFIRIFLPKLPNPRKLPTIIYYHGGGFIILHATTQFFHDLCSGLASHLHAIVLSVEYRLAPEHRLPAAYDDAMDAIMWVRKQALGFETDGSDVDPWMKEYADFNSLFLMGCSAGGNMVYHATLRALGLELSPLRIKGLIYNDPFFGGLERTASELKFSNDKLLPLPVSDLMWELSLPKDANRDHEYCNFRVCEKKDLIVRFPKCVVTGFEYDPLVDKQREFVTMLESHGVPVVARFSEGGFHAAELLDPIKTKEMLDVVKEFVSEA